MNAHCSNTYGSYKCTCKEGYSGTGHVCTGMMNFTIYLPDIDECKSDILLWDVNANCSNTFGSYKCTCKEGYNGTGLACTGIINLLCFNLCLRLGTGILSVESETFLGCFPILYFLKAFLPKIELSIYRGQRYQIRHYFISFVLVAFSALRTMSTLSLF